MKLYGLSVAYLVFILNPCEAFSFLSQGIFSSGKSSRSVADAETNKQALVDIFSSLQKNGKDTPQEKKDIVSAAVGALEKLNPTPRPAVSDKMNGFWRMLYTDFSPAAPSSGQLGPFNGDVFQDLDSQKSLIKNILRLDIPPIRGALTAKQSIYDNKTWQIEFVDVENYFAGFKIQSVKFKTREIRLWKITYLDDDFRVLRARRPEMKEDEAFIFVFNRDEAARMK